VQPKSKSVMLRNKIFQELLEFTTEQVVEGVRMSLNNERRRRAVVSKIEKEARSILSVVRRKARISDVDRMIPSA
jgi:hypothetical protein